MLTVGVVVLGVRDVERAERFWRAALGYEKHPDGFGGWGTVLEPPAGATGAKLALPDFVVLADPDGNRFCIVDLSHH